MTNAVCFIAVMVCLGAGLFLYATLELAAYARDRSLGPEPEAPPAPDPIPVHGESE